MNDDDDDADDDMCCWCSCELGVATAACLANELESCRQLHDLEPDNKCMIVKHI